MSTQSGRRSRTGRKISIRPTGPKSDPVSQYTDIGLTGLLNIHAGQVNSARGVMWQRYGFFFAGNSVFLPLMTRLEYSVLLFPYAVFGMVICWIWYSLLQDDRQVLIWRIQEGSRFRWQQLVPDANVFVFMLRDDQLQHARRIYAKAGLIPWIFFFLYPTVVIYLAWNAITAMLAKIMT